MTLWGGISSILQRLASKLEGLKHSLRARTQVIWCPKPTLPPLSCQPLAHPCCSSNGVNTWCGPCSRWSLKWGDRGDLRAAPHLTHPKLKLCQAPFLLPVADDYFEVVNGKGTLWFKIRNMYLVLVSILSTELLKPLAFPKWWEL